jgi:hypothetical protein
VISLMAGDSSGSVGISSIDLTVTEAESQGFLLAHPDLVDRNQQSMERDLAADR